MSLDQIYLSAIAPGAMPWSPSFLSSKELWLDSNDSSTLSVNLGKVSQWNDKSGNGRNVSQSVSLQQPALATVSGRQTVTGNGGQFLYYGGGTGVNTGECTVACVFYNTSSANWLGIHSAYTLNAGDTGSTGAYAMFGGSNGNAPRFTVNSTQSIGSLAVPTPIAIAVARRSVSANEQKMWVNGVATSASSVSGGAVPSGGFIVLGRRSSTSFGSFLEGGINEVLSLSAAANDATVQKIEGYLAHKWGMTGNLPSSHPYKSTAPSV